MPRYPLSWPRAANIRWWWDLQAQQSCLVFFLGFVVIMSFLVLAGWKPEGGKLRVRRQIVLFAPQNKQINQNRGKTTPENGGGEVLSRQHRPVSGFCCHFWEEMRKFDALLTWCRAHSVQVASFFSEEFITAHNCYCSISPAWLLHPALQPDYLLINIKTKGENSKCFFSQSGLVEDTKSSVHFCPTKVQKCWSWPWLGCGIFLYDASLIWYKLMSVLAWYWSYPITDISSRVILT